jgi:Zn-dependent protease
MSTALAFAFGGLLRVVSGTGQVPLFLYAGLVANVVLAAMNLIPIPGLDASRIVARYLPPRAQEVYSNLDQYCALFILLVVFILAGPVQTFVRVVGNGICQLAAGGPCPTL